MGRAPFPENPAYVPDPNEFLIVIILAFIFFFLYIYIFIYL